MLWKTLFGKKTSTISAASRRVRPEFVTLEDRVVPANLVWSNRGQASDNFQTVFGANAEAARRVVDAVLGAWSQVLVNLNQPAVDGSADRNTISFNVSMEVGRAGFGGSANITKWCFPTQEDKDANRNGHPVEGRITLDRGTVGQPDAGWWIDPTPTVNEEFTNILSPFAASRPDGSVGEDMYATINSEIAHVLGLLDSAPNRFNQPINGTVTRTAIRDRAQGNNVGFYYVFDGPSGTYLLTSYDSGGGDVGGATHTAGPTAPNFPVPFTSRYRNPAQLRLNGSLDAGNAAGGPNTRVLPSDNLANMLKDAFGYEVRLPSTIPGMNFAVGVVNNQITVQGGPDPAPAPTQQTIQNTPNPGGANHGVGRDFEYEGPPSPDKFIFIRDGNDVVVTTDWGRDGFVGGMDPSGSGNAPAMVERVPLNSFTSIRINAAGGADTVTLDFSGGNFLPAGGLDFEGGAGADKLIIKGASGYAIDGNTLTIAGVGQISLGSVNEVQLEGTAGDDTFSVKNFAGPVTFDGKGGNDSYTVDWSGDRNTVRILDSGGINDRLQVTGTPNADMFRLYQGVMAMGTTGLYFPMDGLEQMSIDAGDGDDTIAVYQGTLGTALSLFGGRGNDRLYGSAGSEFISGGDGNDLILGNGGNDVLLGGDGNDTIFAYGNAMSRSVAIGGLGRDTILAGGGGTLAITGTTSYDANSAALWAIAAAWARLDQTYSQRIENVRAGGLAQLYPLTVNTVTDDAEQNVIGSLGGGLNWYWTSATDRIGGRRNTEQVK